MPPLFEVDFAAFRAEGFRHVRHADFNGLRGGIITYFWLIFIEQNLGPHMEQKCATLPDSCGRVSS